MSRPLITTTTGAVELNGRQPLVTSPSGSVELRGAAERFSVTSVHDDDVVRAVPSSVGNPVRYTAVADELFSRCTLGATVSGTAQQYTGDGFVVGDGENSTVLELDSPDLYDRILAWVLAVAPIVSSRADYYFGVWADWDGRIHLDVAQVFSREDEIYARHAIRVRGELCGWDNGRGEALTA